MEDNLLQFFCFCNTELYVWKEPHHRYKGKIWRLNCAFKRSSDSNYNDLTNMENHITRPVSQSQIVLPMMVWIVEATKVAMLFSSLSNKTKYASLLIPVHILWDDNGTCRHMSAKLIEIQQYLRLQKPSLAATTSHKVRKVVKENKSSPHAGNIRESALQCWQKCFTCNKLSHFLVKFMAS